MGCMAILPLPSPLFLAPLIVLITRPTAAAPPRLFSAAWCRQREHPTKLCGCCNTSTRERRVGRAWSAICVARSSHSKGRLTRAGGYARRRLQHRLPRRLWGGEAVGIVNMPIDEFAEGAAHIVCELLAIARLPHRPVPIQGVAQRLDLTVTQVVQPQPLNVEETTKAIEGVHKVAPPSSGLANRTSHECVPLESLTAIHGEDENNKGRTSEGFVHLLFVLLLCCPQAVPNRLHDVFLGVAGDYKIQRAVSVHVDLCPTWRP
mmetsp:Transcript_24323/g.46197  ORF Transcript_24323/g.46197 Transcript_24323/m.46197 type:complete len:262 (+) Transcript_24323:36-821(+)